MACDSWLLTCLFRCKQRSDLLQVDCQNLSSAGLLQVVLTSCNKSENATGRILTNLLQLDEIDKFIATC